jgi:hypothetical protein
METLTKTAPSSKRAPDAPAKNKMYFFETKPIGQISTIAAMAFPQVGTSGAVSISQLRRWQRPLLLSNFKRVDTFRVGIVDALYDCLAGDLIVAEQVSVHPARFVQGHDVFREIDLAGS